jgi:hypothetical protein
VRHTLILAATLANLLALAVNISITARADVAGMSWRDLVRDRDFRTAVQQIVEGCDARNGSISC